MLLSSMASFPYSVKSYRKRKNKLSENSCWQKNKTKQKQKNKKHVLQNVKFVPGGVEDHLLVCSALSYITANKKKTIMQLDLSHSLFSTKGNTVNGGCQSTNHKL